MVSLRAVSLDNDGQEKRHKVEQLLASLQDHSCNLSDASLSEIDNLSTKRITRLCNIVNRLAKHDILNSETFTEALRRVSLHLAPIEMSQVKIEKYEDTLKLTLDSGLTFYLAINTVPHIRLDLRDIDESIRLGFSDAKKTRLRWAIKAVSYSFRHGENTVAVARREAKYNSFMGRQSFFYKKNNIAHLGYEWLDGECLHLLRDDIVKLALIDRLKLLASVITEINKLHLLLLVHNDVHTGNIIRESQSLDVQLIDFESSHKANSVDDFEVDTQDIHYVIKDLLFADIYRKRQQELRLNEKAIMHLDHALKAKGLGMKCTSQQALNYCNLLLKNFDSLSGTKLQEILDSTLNRGTFDSEDAMRGSERPSMFSKI